MALGRDQFHKNRSTVFQYQTKYYNTLGTTRDPLDRKVSSEMSMVCYSDMGLKYGIVFPRELSEGESQEKRYGFLIR